MLQRKNCPTCGYVNSHEMKTCNECGGQLFPLKSGVVEATDSGTIISKKIDEKIPIFPSTSSTVFSVENNNDSEFILEQKLNTILTPLLGKIEILLEKFDQSGSEQSVQFNELRDRIQKIEWSLLNNNNNLSPSPSTPLSLPVPLSPDLHFHFLEHGVTRVKLVERDDQGFITRVVEKDVLEEKEEASAKSSSV